MAKRLLKGEFEQTRGYSRAVRVDGGATVFLAGLMHARDADGRSLAGDLPAQARGIFERMAQTLGEMGGGLRDVAAMTVYLTDARYGDEFTRLRADYFSDDYPASTMVTVAGLARPEALIEVTATAVLEG